MLAGVPMGAIRGGSSGEHDFFLSRLAHLSPPLARSVRPDVSSLAGGCFGNPRQSLRQLSCWRTSPTPSKRLRSGLFSCLSDEFLLLTLHARRRRWPQPGSPSGGHGDIWIKAYRRCGSPARTQSTKSDPEERPESRGPTCARLWHGLEASSRAAAAPSSRLSRRRPCEVSAGALRTERPQ